MDGFCQKGRAFFFEILGELDLEERALGDDFFADFLVDGVSEDQDAFYFPEDVFLQFLLVHLKVYLYDLAIMMKLVYQCSIIQKYKSSVLEVRDAFSLPKDLLADKYRYLYNCRQKNREQDCGKNCAKCEKDHGEGR